MNNLVEAAGTFVWGACLALFFFGGLWLTLRRLTTAGGSVLLLLGSFVVRTAVTLTGLYLVMGGRWERLLACFAGFLAMRTVMLARAEPLQPVAPAQEGESPWT